MQLPNIAIMAFQMGITQAQGAGVEGDDILGLTVKACEDQNQPSVIISGDADFLQLVSPLTSVYSPLQYAKPRHITYENMKDAKGLEPWQWLEYKALLGDKSDDIPGVDGVGKKTALSVLQRFGTVAAFNVAVAESKHKPNAYEKRILNGGAAFQKAKSLMDLILEST